MIYPILLYFLFVGWTGLGCNEPDCPGTPNCFGRGHCNTTNRETPQCTDCVEGWMGPTCNDPCVHGHPNRGVCICDHPCYADSGCQLECSGRGTCVDGSCSCNFDNNIGWQGEHCELDGCPGINGNCNSNGSVIRCGLEMIVELQIVWGHHLVQVTVVAMAITFLDNVTAIATGLGRRVRYHVSMASIMETLRVVYVNHVTLV